MSGFIAEVDPNVQAAREEAAAGGNGTYPPIPAGRYQVQIVPLNPAKNLPMELVDFGGSGPNSQKKMVRVAVKVVDHSPTGKGRWFAGRVPLFSRFAPKDGAPVGKPARAYFDFWEKVVGLPAEVVMSGNLGVGPEHILGKYATVTLSVKQPRDAKDAEHNPLGTNEIEFWDAPLALGDTTGTPALAPGVPVAPWLDGKGNLIPGFVFDYLKAPGAPAQGGAPAAQPPAQLWGAPAAQAPAAPVAQAPAAAPVAQPAAPGWGTPGAPAWGAPATPPPAAAPVAAPAGDAIQQAAVAAASY